MLIWKPGLLELLAALGYATDRQRRPSVDMADRPMASTGRTHP